MSNTCGWWIGPVWKADGETCVCIKPQGHTEEDHKCSCGTWFAQCGHAPTERHPMAAEIPPVF